jgi:hypothetical protein
MRRATGVLALATVLLASPLADGCGDKLLSIARGIRLNHAYKASHPASIMLYVGDLANVNTSEERSRLVQLSILYMSLRQAGHELDVAQNEKELSKALKDKQFDFLMADIRDVEVVAEQAAIGASGAEVLPVMFKPKKADLAAAQERFNLVLKTPATNVNHLEAIDRVMESRSEGASPGS